MGFLASALSTVQGLVQVRCGEVDCIGIYFDQEIQYYMIFVGKKPHAITVRNAMQIYDGV